MVFLSMIFSLIFRLIVFAAAFAWHGLKGFLAGIVKRLDLYMYANQEMRSRRLLCDGGKLSWVMVVVPLRSVICDSGVVLWH